MKNYKATFYTLLLLFGLTAAQAQQTMPASGGMASGTGGSASYTVGQVVYTTHSGTNGSVAQGIQQAFEISTMTATSGAKSIQLQCAVYPNPTTDFMVLKTDILKTANLKFMLYDLNGRVVLSNKIEADETSITMSNLATATYFLTVSNGEVSKTFTIIKN